MTGQKIADNDIYSKNAYIDLIHNCNANIADSWEAVARLIKYSKQYDQKVQLCQ